jgi:hypothetical protein
MSMYSYCPIGGLVCTCCQYPVNISNKENMVKAIWRHERQSQNHKVKKTEIERQQIVSEYKEYIKTISIMLRSMLCQGEENLAVKYFKSLVGSEKQYKLCTECNVLVNDAAIHKKRSHTKYCTQQQLGLMSKYWTLNNPKIYNCSVSFKDNINHGILCKFLVQEIGTINNSNDCIMSENETVLLQMINEKELEFKEIGKDVEISVQLEHETNSWIRRVGWDRHLEGMNVGKLLELCVPETDDNLILQRFINVFDNLVMTSYDLLQKKTNPAGLVRWSMNRNRQHSDSNIEKSTTRPFTMIHMESLQNIFLLCIHSFVYYVV